MFCLKQDPSGYTQVGCDTADALIVVNRVELGQMSPFAMDIGSALAIGGAMLTCMAVAWVLRLARLSLGAVDSAEGS
jgi:hypothetical protein